MAVITSISQAELARLAAAAYEGLPYRVCLALNGSSNFTADSSVSDWDSVEVSGNGYARAEGFIENGEYNQATARFELPRISAEYAASGGIITYDTVYLVIDDGYTETLHSITTEFPTVDLVDGASVIYRFTLATDD
jgi:hypothetical protein